jgi:D-beta-D-heptose 7-phosphate kinase/D-beta-D-heptose 1-phosphate adenosyltransferase
MAFDLDTEKIAQSHVLVIGDVMLDRYLWGNVERISPEAPVPVFHTKKTSEVPGGAGNVVSNLAALGCSITVIGVCGDDVPGRRLIKLMNNDKIQTHLLKDSERPTITKTRIISSGQQLLRLDEENGLPLTSNARNDFLNLVDDSLPKCNAVIISDYGKGVLQTAGVAQHIINLAKNHSLPVLVDPKGQDWKRYEGATCITPNARELEIVYGHKTDDKEKLVDAMRSIGDKLRLTWLLVTRGSLGMCLMDEEGEPLFIPAIAREVYDVSGAGDTVIATLSLGIVSGLTFPEAAHLANLAAGIVVGKVGTQPISLFELKASLGINGVGSIGNYINKVASLSAAKLQVQAWQANGQTVVFTNGCFDLLHPGHIHLLNQAKDLGDRLIVALNSDASVRRLKGPSRPILNVHDRASLLGSLNCVDLVVVFEDDTPRNLLENLKPDLLVKGADYKPAEVVGREIVESFGGKVKLIPFIEGYSTTNITDIILQNHK